MKKIIGVFGAGRLPEHDPLWEEAVEVGRKIASAGCILLTGGLGGIMTAASKGAREMGGTTVGILPFDMGRGALPNPYVDIPIYTGLGEARNVINVKSCHGAIAIGGEYGTLSEIALALKAGCPIVLLHSWECLREEPDHPGRVLRARDAAEAAALALKAAAERF